jgi:hypothetical protein
MSERKKRSRVLKSESTLSGYLTLGEEFHIGLALTPDIVKGLDLKKFGLDTVNYGDVKVPKAAGPTTKANINGKVGRKQPEKKHEIEKHIDYIRKKDGRRIEYDRVYEVWEKELKHKFNIAFTFKKDVNGENTVFSPLLVFDNTPVNNMKNTHVMNVFLEVFGFSDLYRPNLSPLVKYEKSFDEEILPPGNLGERENFDALIEIAERHVSPEDLKPLLHRLELFKEFNPIIRQSAKGLSGYYAFIFKDKGIVAAESIKRDNATYFFKEEDYENTIIKDKQDIINNNLMLKRLSHTDNWEQNARKFLNKF